MKLVILKLALAAIVALPVLAFLDCGAKRLDRMLPDAEGVYSSVWVRTKDVGPGDDMVITVMTHVGYRSAIGNVHARFGDSTVDAPGEGPTWGSTVSTRGSNEDDHTLVVPIPLMTATGPMHLDLTIDLAIAASASGGFETQTKTDHITVPIEILDPDTVTSHRLVDRALAALAWLVALSIVYAAVRWVRRRGHSLAPAAGRTTAELALIAILLVIATVAMIGQLVFVRPVARSLAVPSATWMSVLMLVWCAALVLGAWLGRRARNYDARWKSARLRTIIGIATGDAYREVALPPMLSRDVEPLPPSDIVGALRSRNLDARLRRNRIEISTAAGPAIRLRARTAWAPSTTRMTILDGYRPETAVVVATLAGLFGPIEYMSPHGTAVAYDSSGSITSGPLSDTVW